MPRFSQRIEGVGNATKLPTQLLWESTLSRGRGTEDPATCLELFHGIIYKAVNLLGSLTLPHHGRVSSALHSTGRALIPTRRPEHASLRLSPERARLVSVESR